MPSLLSPSTPETPTAPKVVINVIVVCGTVFLLAYSMVFNDPNDPLEHASTLDYIFAFEPLFSLLVIMGAVRGGWLDWTKEHYDRMKFPLSGVELLTFAGLFSGFCFIHQSTSPILPDESRVDWVTYAVIYLIALLGLVWSSQQDNTAGGMKRIWSAIWCALMLFVIGADMFLNVNIASASRTERMVFGYINSKYVTTSKNGNHSYHVYVTSPTDSNRIVSLSIDRLTWDRISKGDAIRLRHFRGGLGQDYWQYER